MTAASSSESGSPSSVNDRPTTPATTTSAFVRTTLPATVKPTTDLTAYSLKPATPSPTPTVPNLINVAQLKLDTDEHKKTETRQMNLLNMRMRETTRTLKSSEKERDETVKNLHSLHAKKRRLDEDLQPMEKKKRQLEVQIEASKKRSSINKIVALMLEQDDPVLCLGEVCGRFGRRLVELLREKAREDGATKVKIEDEAGGVKEARRSVSATKATEVETLDGTLATVEAPGGLQTTSTCEDGAFWASMTSISPQRQPEIKRATSE